MTKRVMNKNIIRLLSGLLLLGAVFSTIQESYAADNGVAPIDQGLNSGYLIQFEGRGHEIHGYSKYKKEGRTYFYGSYSSQKAMSILQNSFRPGHLSLMIEPPASAEPLPKSEDLLGLNESDVEWFESWFEELPFENFDENQEWLFTVRKKGDQVRISFSKKVPLDPPDHTQIFTGKFQEGEPFWEGQGRDFAEAARYFIYSGPWATSFLQALFDENGYEEVSEVLSQAIHFHLKRKSIPDSLVKQAFRTLLFDQFRKN